MDVIYKVRNPERDYIEGQGILIDSFNSDRKYLDTFRLVVLKIIKTIVKGNYKADYAFLPCTLYICADKDGIIFTIEIIKATNDSIVESLPLIDAIQAKYKSRCPEMFEISSLSRGDIKYGG